MKYIIHNNNLLNGLLHFIRRFGPAIPVRHFIENR